MGIKQKNGIGMSKINFNELALNASTNLLVSTQLLTARELEPVKVLLEYLKPECMEVGIYNATNLSLFGNPLDEYEVEFSDSDDVVKITYDELVGILQNRKLFNQKFRIINLTKNLSINSVHYHKHCYVTYEEAKHIFAIYLFYLIDVVKAYGNWRHIGCPIKNLANIVEINKYYKWFDIEKIRKEFPVFTNDLHDDEIISNIIDEITYHMGHDTRVLLISPLDNIDPTYRDIHIELDNGVIKLYVSEDLRIVAFNQLVKEGKIIV